jgi:hypothetical protein
MAVDSTKGRQLSIKELRTKNLKDYSLLSRNLNSLIENDLFADVYFEVEGHIVPAHRNILVCRSDYFRAMLGSHAAFKESAQSHSSPEHAIYIKDIRYDEFTQILSFLYTGHIEVASLPYDVIIGLMKLADSMNLCELEQLCLFQLSNLMNQDNVIKIFKEAYELSPDILKNVIQLCFDVISVNFSYVSRSEDFCALPQDLMLRIIENVVPKLARLNSVQVNSAAAPTPNQNIANTNRRIEQNFENQDSDEDED